MYPCAAPCACFDAAGGVRGQALGVAVTDRHVGAEEVDVLALKQAKLVADQAKVVKVIKSGELSKKVVLKGIGATAGAKAAIEAAGGSVG